MSACAAAVVGALAVSGTATVRAGGGVPADASFRVADGSVGCAFSDGRVACRSATMDTAAVLDRDGSTALRDVPVAWNASTPVLRPTESWWHGDFTCRIADASVVCLTLDGGTIAVGDGHLVGAAPPALATLP